MLGNIFSTINPFRSTQPKERPFFSQYEGNVSLSLINASGEKDLRFHNGSITLESNDDWSYSMVVKPPNHYSHTSANNEMYAFPVSKDMNLVQSFPDNSKVTCFEISLDKTNTLCLEFETDDDEFEHATKFLYIFVRLCYQTEHKRSYEFATSEQDFAGYWAYKNDKKPMIPEFVQEILDSLKKEKSAEFYCVGELSTYDPKDPVSKPHVFSPHWVLTIRNKDNFAYNIELITENGNKVLEQSILQNLQYNVNEDGGSFTWLSDGSEQQVAYNFKLLEPKAAASLKFVMVVIIMQINQKTDINTIIEKEKKDWDQYYMQDKDDNLNDEKVEYKNYHNSNKMRLEFSAEPKQANMNPVITENVAQNPINLMSQAKCLDRTFVNRGNVIEVFKTDEDNENHAHIMNLPKLMNQKKEDFTPGKMFLQEQDTKIVMSDNQNPNLYYYDIEKGVVSHQIINEKMIEDICPFEKSSNFGPEQNFFGVTQQNILRFDPRTAEGVAQDRAYKTNYQFNTIMSATQGNIAVGSKNGDIRMIKEVGDRAARNVLPSMLGDNINGIDTSKDGAWVLATSNNYLLLFPTNQQGKNGFNYQFKKECKPTPKVLRVNPRSLAKFGITNLKFLSAKFDHKADECESYISASSGPYMFIWTMKNILKGNFVTNVVKKMADDIVSNEFKYNTDALIAATTRNLHYQKTSQQGNRYLK